MSEKTLIKMIEYLIDNIMFEYAEEVFRQVIGIPMGTDCGPYLANLYLFALEYKWMTRMMTGKSDYGIALKGKDDNIEEWTKEEKEERKKAVEQLKMVARFIDDGLTVNGLSVLMKYIDELYPGMTVKKENEVDHKTHFLDLNLVINLGKILMSTYDKRDDFPFEVRSFPNLKGNIHFRRSHGILVGQLRRFALTCDHYSDFNRRVRTVTSRLLEQGFEKELLKEYAKRFYQTYEDWVSKYKVNIERFVNSCFKVSECAKNSMKRAGKNKEVEK